MLTEKLKIMKCSRPFSLEIPANIANVGSSSLELDKVKLLFGKHHSSFLNVFLVNIVSSI